MSETRTLVEFLAQLQTRSLPDHVIQRAKIHILDTLAVAVGGSTTDHAGQSVAMIRALGAPGNSTVVASDLRTNVLEAAFLNGVMAHSIDFDDAHKFVHPGAAIVPTALAFAESEGAEHSEFLKAVVCGYEAAVRVSLAAGPSHRARGFHPTGTCNVIGTAVAVGVLLKLDADQMVSAVGIATSQAAGLTQYRIDGAATKHLHAGFAARAGGSAALLARQGLRGPEASIEGTVGFLKAFADEADAEALTRDLGQSWAIATTDIKPYPSCRQTHAPLDLILNLLRQNRISHDQIEAVRLATYKYVDKPWHTDTALPGSALEGMLSVPYCLASAAVYGQVTLANFGDEARADDRIHQLLGKIAISFDEDMTARWPTERGAALTLETLSGTFEASASNPRGGVDQPVEWPEAVGKARGLTDSVLGAAAAERLVEAVSRLDQPGRVADLAQLLAGKGSISMADQIAVPCVLMRGGTSKGPYFKRSDMPADQAQRDKLLLAVMGSPDIRQIDGIGGADTLTSKVAIVGPSSREGVDVDYMFAQVAVDKAVVDTNPSCGNMLSGVGPFAIETGMVAARAGETRVVIYDENTGSRIEAIVQTDGQSVVYGGSARIDGVPGEAAPVQLNFMDIVGSKTGSLLPTGNLIETIDGVGVTLVDVAVPMMIFRAADLGKTGYESAAELDADKQFFARMEAMRLEAGRRMGLGDVTGKVIPKTAMLAAPAKGGTVCARYFVPHKAHAAFAVTGGLCVASCAMLVGSVSDGLAVRPEGGRCQVEIEHPSGSLEIALTLHTGGPLPDIVSGGILRSARKLMAGNVFVPAALIG